MTRRRFYAPPDTFAQDGAEVTLSAEESRHLRDVLRLREGDEAFVFDGEGREFPCVVRSLAGRGANVSATLEVRGQVEPQRPESPLRLMLCVALLKGEKFDLVVQKATELGVSGIVPVLTKRADVRPHDAHHTTAAARRVERWRRLALEAAKQSGRARVPEVSAPVSFASLVEVAAPDESSSARRVMFAERGGRGLVEVINKWHDGRALEVTALVGPEGGWADEEIEAARVAGWDIVTLGGRTLRAETAALVVAALLQNLLGDLV